MNLGIIIGSTRQNRQTPKQALWIYNSAKEISGVEPEIVDLKDYPMPFFDEPASPRYNSNRIIDEKVQPWLKKLVEFDAYIFVTPEYNHSIPAVLKNALDYVTFEMSRKPSAIASHGSVGGARAAMHLKEILSESKTVCIPNSVAIKGMSELIDEQGNLADEVKANPYGSQTGLASLLEELKWYGDALKSAS